MDDTTKDLIGHEERDRTLFDNIATHYCSKDLLASSRIARRQRLRHTFSILPGSQLGDILEAGCGAGFSALHLNRPTKSFTGIDYSEKLIELAREQHFHRATLFEVANIKEYKPETCFDVIFMIGVLHHIDVPLEALQYLTTLLNPGGWLIVNEPQPGNPLVSKLRKLRKLTDPDYSDEQLEMSFESLESLFSKAGLIDIRKRGQGCFSTPFAEVIMKPQFLTAPISTLACLLDKLVECLPFPFCKKLCWNAIIAGRRPG